MIDKILEYRVGSHLYGTNTKTSDEDFSGVFMPNENQVFGFERIDQIDLSVKSKLENGKNDSDAKDIVLYEFRKFIRLALDNNPNILEQLFVNKENLTFSNHFGNSLLEKRFLFPHQGLKNKFLGYAFSQKHKMVIRTDSFFALENAYEWLEENTNTVEKSKRLLIEVVENLPFFSIKGDNIKCGDLNFQRHHMLRFVKKSVKNRLSNVTNRKNLLTKYGFDTKYASHLIRLIREGIELLETGELKFPLSYADELLDIKNGKWKMTDVLKYADELESQVDSLVATTKLSKKQNYNEIQKFTIDTLKFFHLKNQEIQ